MSYYDTAQVCLNGHTITRNATGSPEFTQKFCSTCGEATVTACNGCNQQIRGEYHVEGVITVGFVDSPPPRFCHACGKAFPWTDRRLEAAKALAEELEDLSLADRDKLKQSLDDLHRAGPQAEVAAVKFKKIMAKVGKESCNAMRKIVVDVLTQAARKSIFGSE